MCEQIAAYTSELIRTDVTAVKNFQQYIVAGIGSNVYLYKQTNPNICIGKLHALNGQKIYGFILAECGSKILVFGGKQYTIICLHSNANIDNYTFVRLFEPIVCDDWLHAAVWIDDVIALLTAHNVVEKWSTKSQTLLSKHSSADNSILFSGLLVPLLNDVLVMAGTVFSEVIIHCLSDEKPIHTLKGHKGVIFSISCHPQKHLIVTTSDDRSVRIWGPNELPQEPFNILEYWHKVNIVCHNVLYGHTARVMRSCISDHNIVSVGEDSAVCQWDFQGNLLKKSMAHQNGEIWAVDTNNEFILTGGADSAVIIHPVITCNDFWDSRTIHVLIGTPRKLKITKRRNLAVLNENDLIYYDTTNDVFTKYKLNHETTYKMLDINDMKDIIAVADMNGKLDLYEEDTERQLSNLLNTKLDIGKILSMHYVSNNCLVFCSENGVINVINIINKITEVCDTFILPPCKERWFTAAAQGFTDFFVFGDRCGNIHIYKKQQKHPIKSFSKVHGRYGPTSIIVNDKAIVSTGRDGTIKYFAFNGNNPDEFKYMYSKDLEFEWIDKILGKNEELVCGFRERVFVIYDLSSNSNIVDIPCGGGHRSWDVVSYFDKNEEYVQFVYIKSADIIAATVHKTRIRSTRVIDGWHSKEINSLKPIFCNKDDAVFYISGSEDTTLRITASSKDNELIEKLVFKHLSSVKAIQIYKLENGKYLVLSAGGRAQICIKTIDISRYSNIKAFEEVNYMIKGTDRERKGVKSWRECTTDFDPETRVMDVDLIKDGDCFLIIAGCSDGVLRIFTYNHKDNMDSIKLVNEVKYHKTCILKTNYIMFHNNEILAVCTTRGEVSFWDVPRLKTNVTEPRLLLKTNKSGINSFSFNPVSAEQFLIATGGDDNAIHLKLLSIDQNNLESIKVEHSWSSSQYHSSEITGLSFVDKYLISASIDQRVTLFEWRVSDEGILCKFLSQHWTDVADVHGLEFIKFCGDTISLCVYGKGMEVLNLSVKKYSEIGQI